MSTHNHCLITAMTKMQIMEFVWERFYINSFNAISNVLLDWQTKTLLLKEWEPSRFTLSTYLVEVIRDKEDKKLDRHSISQSFQ